LIEKSIKRIQRYTQGENHYIRRAQAREFFSCFYSELNPEDRKKILHFLYSLDRNWIYRLTNTISLPYYRQTLLDDLVFKLTYIAGKV